MPRFRQNDGRASTRLSTCGRQETRPHLPLLAEARRLSQPRPTTTLRLRPCPLYVPRAWQGWPPGPRAQPRPPLHAPRSRASPASPLAAASLAPPSSRGGGTPALFWVPAVPGPSAAMRRTGLSEHHRRTGSPGTWQKIARWGVPQRHARTVMAAAVKFQTSSSSARTPRIRTRSFPPYREGASAGGPGPYSPLVCG